MCPVSPADNSIVSTISTEESQRDLRTLQKRARCRALQSVAERCRTLQNVAERCKTLRAQGPDGEGADEDRADQNHRVGREVEHLGAACTLPNGPQKALRLQG